MAKKSLTHTRKYLKDPKIREELLDQTVLRQADIGVTSVACKKSTTNEEINRILSKIDQDTTRNAFILLTIGMSSLMACIICFYLGV